MSEGLTRQGFQADLALGQQYEGEFARILSQVGESIEVKADHGTIKTGNVFVEFEQPSRDGGRKPSGIALEPGADLWVFVLVGLHAIVVVQKAKLLELCVGAEIRRGGDNNQYLGYLVPVSALVA